GCSTPGGSVSGGVSGGAKQKTSVLQIGFAPRPVPRGSRMTPPRPVFAPPYGSMAEGWLGVSTLNQAWWPSLKRTTPGVSCKTLTDKSSVDNARRGIYLAGKMDAQHTLRKRQE